MESQSGYSFPDLHLYELDNIEILDSPILDDDVTLESNMRFDSIVLPDIAPPPMGPPDRTPIVNCYNFKVEISSVDTNKKKYVYSNRLNRIYVDMACDFPVQFSWQNMPGDRVYVRATVVFTDKDQAEKRVERCMQHRHEDAADLPEAARMGVLRSSRELGTQGVEYGGGGSTGAWNSVRVELPNGPPKLHAYRFVCKNSCSSGINRRPISVIFTLEDAHGIVYGREMTGARVCACPRRDLKKDEEAEGVFLAGKKRVPSNQLRSPRAKKVKLELVPASPGPGILDDNVLALPQLQVVGANVLTTGLEMMVRMMEQGISARSDDAQYVANCTSSIASLKAAIQQYKSTNSQ